MTSEEGKLPNVEYNEGRKGMNEIGYLCGIRDVCSSGFVCIFVMNKGIYDDNIIEILLKPGKYICFSHSTRNLFYPFRLYLRH